MAGPPPSAVDGPLSSSRESSSHGNTVCLPSETSFTDSPPTPSVRTQPPTPTPRRGATRLEKAVSPLVREPAPFPRGHVCCWRVPAGSVASRGLWKATGRGGSPCVCRTEVKPEQSSRRTRGLSFRRWTSGHLEIGSCHTQKVENAASFLFGWWFLEKGTETESGCVLSCVSGARGLLSRAPKVTAELRLGTGKCLPHREEGTSGRAGAKQAGGARPHAGRLDVWLPSLHECLPPHWGPRSPHHGRVGRGGLMALDICGEDPEGNVGPL